MNRRGFLAGLAALVGGVAIEQAIPFGRVWSFPKRIVVSRAPHALPGRIDRLSLKHWFKLENQAIEFYESAGQTLFPVYIPGLVSTPTVSYALQGDSHVAIRHTA